MYYFFETEHLEMKTWKLGMKLNLGSGIKDFCAQLT